MKFGKFWDDIKEPEDEKSFFGFLKELPLKDITFKSYIHNATGIHWNNFKEYKLLELK